MLTSVRVAVATINEGNFGKLFSSKIFPVLLLNPF